MTLLQAILLGIVEGLTEFLPVSSTGHLILTAEAMNLDEELVENYTIVIQLGAILAVAAYYPRRVASLFRGIFAADPKGRRLLVLLMAAFIPAAVVGLLFEDMIEERLFGSAPVAWALIVGGIVMIAVEMLFTKRREPQVTSVDQASLVDAVAIGFFQCFSLWPGTSRSMSTIVGAQVRGFSNEAAAEFSFLLALPTLGAATVYKFFSAFPEFQRIDGAMPALVVGNIVAFVVAFLAIWGFIRLITKVGMSPFGVYRIILGIVVLLML